MARTRPMVVSGLFYPDNPEELRGKVQGYLADAYLALSRDGTGPLPKAILVPHAGYDYSGPVAASGYVHLLEHRDRIRRVVLIGPSHRVWFSGLALSSMEAFASPLGDVKVDRAANSQVVALPQTRFFDEPFASEHDLEVQLPFLQVVLTDFTIVPLLVGDASAHEVAEVLTCLWNGPETLIVATSDLSHYHDYETARKLDLDTSRSIEALSPEEIREHQACGCKVIRGLLLAARERKLEARTVDLRTSGDTAGLHDRVVGYGAYVFREHLEG